MLIGLRIEDYKRTKTRLFTNGKFGRFLGRLRRLECAQHGRFDRLFYQLVQRCAECRRSPASFRLFAAFLIANFKPMVEQRMCEPLSGRRSPAIFDEPPCRPNDRDDRQPRYERDFGDDAAQGWSRRRLAKLTRSSGAHKRRSSRHHRANFRRERGAAAREVCTQGAAEFDATKLCQHAARAQSRSRLCAPHTAIRQPGNGADEVARRDLKVRRRRRWKAS